MVDVAVAAADQLFASDAGKEKKAYVVAYFASHGVKFDADTVDKMIEASVLNLHASLNAAYQPTEVVEGPAENIVTPKVDAEK